MWTLSCPSKRTEGFMPCQIFLMMGGKGGIGTRGNPNKSYAIISMR